MNPIIGWALAALGIAAGYVGWGWCGVVLGFTVMVFWLLLQFTRALRAMRTAGGAPVGRVASAVLRQAKLKPRLRLMDVIQLTQSLGEKLADEAPGQPETFRWTDDSGASVTLRLKGGRVVDWDFSRPAVDEPPTAA